MTHKIDPENPLPRYYQVYSSLRERINSGEFEPDTALPAERQLVKDYGVSRITIVKALDALENDGLIRREHGRGTFVNDPGATAEGMETIAFICGVMLHPYIYSVLMGIARASSEKGYRLNVIGLHEEDNMNKALVLRQIDSQNIAGVLTYPRPGKKDLSMHQELQARGIPLVMIDRYYEEIAADYVVFDEEVASYRMIRHLIEQGHERIALVTHHEVETTSILNRIRGYQRALEEDGLYRDNLLWFDVYADLHISRGRIGSRKNTERLRERLLADKATAVLAVNHDVAERLNQDLMIINTENARSALDRGGASDYQNLEVAIAAFGYRNFADYSTYNIITGLQLGEDLGSTATELLIDRLSGARTGDPVAIHIPTQILYPPGAYADTQHPHKPRSVKGGD
jgi:DNA-binding LacI/PurR family transcriptional regulator